MLSLHSFHQNDANKQYLGIKTDIFFCLALLFLIPRMHGEQRRNATMLCLHQVTSLLHGNGNFQICTRWSDGVRRCVQVGERCLFEGHISSHYRLSIYLVRFTFLEKWQA